jgi:peptidoglycan/xylan/chitin deacetylase (PgdA/CDA1 family)
MIFKKYFQQGAEFGCHGLVHVDFSQLRYEHQVKHMDTALNFFKQHEIPCHGFRPPYLKWDSNTTKALIRTNYEWSSNQAILWDVLKQTDFKERYWNDYQKGINNLYFPKTENEAIPLPNEREGMIDIPVSIPDDEILIDRLRITNQEHIFDCWKAIFDKIYQSGGVFVHITHHERMSYFNEALDALLKYATNAKYSTWIATLQEIYQWWKERNTFSFRIEKSGENEYCVQCNCSPRATVLLKRQFNSAGCSWDNYHVIQDRPFIYRGTRKPAIGIPHCASDELQSNLRSFGFAYEISSRQEDYEMFLDEKQYAGKSARDLMEFIENSSGKVLRFWNWPDGHKCAFSASSDVDSITLFDFYYRAKEFTNYRAFIKTEEQSRDKEKNKV